MKYLYNYSFLFLFTFIIFISACSKDEDPDTDTDIPENVLPTTLSDSIESGNIGEYIKVNDTVWELYIGNDNNNTALPSSWRSWWHVKMENVVTTATTELTIRNSGWPYFYIPVYSYNQKEWFRFDQNEVIQKTNGDIIVQKQFTHKSVRIAMFYPYTFTDLENYIQKIQGNQYLNIVIPGYSQENKPIYLFKITDSEVPVFDKKRVFIHARTHPAETPGSFVIEGMIDYLLSGSTEASILLKEFEFYIFPMQNVDGVIAGNYRSTPKSENLEMMWTFDPMNPLDLISATPPEVALLHQTAKNLMTDGGPPVSIALNLHASNSEYDVRPFFFPHFGTESQGYAPLEASLWNKQLHFISSVASQHGFNMIEPIPSQGGASFVTKTYPESWWWANFHDQVMAITMEMTYGRAGYAPKWIEPNDMKQLGISVLLGINDYYQMPSLSHRDRLHEGWENRKNGLKYPELYPPSAPDEMKK